MGQVKKTKGSERYLALLQRLVRAFAIFCTTVVSWSILSYFLIPKLNYDICITDPRMRIPETLKAIEEVVEAFNRRKINLRLSCNPLSNINLSYNDIDDVHTLAQAWPHYVSVDLKARRGDHEYIVTEIFIPAIRVTYLPIPIQFSEKNIDRIKGLDFQLVLIHELGHALGAPHIFYDEKHIMYPSIYFDEGKTIEQAVDQVKEATHWIQKYK